MPCASVVFRLQAYRFETVAVPIGCNQYRNASGVVDDQHCTLQGRKATGNIRSPRKITPAKEDMQSTGCVNAPAVGKDKRNILVRKIALRLTAHRMNGRMDSCHDTPRFILCVVTLDEAIARLKFQEEAVNILCTM
jgi:hypothetical protein